MLAAASQPRTVVRNNAGRFASSANSSLSGHTKIAASQMRSPSTPVPSAAKPGLLQLEEASVREGEAPAEPAAETSVLSVGWETSVLSRRLSTALNTNPQSKRKEVEETATMMDLRRSKRDSWVKYPVAPTAKSKPQTQRANMMARVMRFLGCDSFMIAHKKGGPLDEPPIAWLANTGAEHSYFFSPTSKLDFFGIDPRHQTS